MKKKTRQIGAIICLSILVILLLTTFVLGIIGNKYFLGFLFLSFIIPVIFWIPFWVMGLREVAEDVADIVTKEEEEK